MKKINIAVIGNIGVGKSTLIQNLSTLLNDYGTVEIMREPSVSVPQVNEALENFYKNDSWAYPLQLLISAFHVAKLREMQTKEYDFLLADMPYSSYIYGKIHQENGLINQKEFSALTECYESFPFDYVIYLTASKEENKKHIEKRNREAREGKITDQLDLSIDDTSYLDNHIKLFEKYSNELISKYFPDAYIISKEVPDILKPQYSEMLKDMIKIIKENRKWQ